MKSIARWLFIRYWIDEIIDAHHYVQAKMLQASRNTGARQEYPIREAGGAMEVLVRLRLFEVGNPE